jgi:type I restriction enzyme S subunit
MSNLNLPDGWKQCKIEEIANIYVGRDLKEESYSKTKTEKHTYPVYSNSVDNYGLYGYYDFEEYPSNCLTVVGRGVGLGTAFPRDKGFGAIGRLLVVSPKEKAFNARYLSEYINTRLTIYNESSGIPQLPGASFAKYKVILPTYDEQVFIANLLELWDTAIEKTEALIDAKERQFGWLKSKLIGQQNAHTAKLGDHFGKSIIIEKGKPLIKANIAENGNIPVIAGGKSSPYSHDQLTHSVPCITISASGAYAGYVWYHDYPIWASDCNVIYSTEHSTKYLYFALKMKQSRIYAFQSGGGQPHIYARDLKNISIPLPPLEEQTRIAIALKTAQQEITLLKKLADQYRTQKRGLMQKLLSGEWHIKNKEAA